LTVIIFLRRSILVKHPDHKIQISRETDPEQIGEQKPKSRLRDFGKSDNSNNNSQPEKNNFHQRGQRRMPAEKAVASPARRTNLIPKPLAVSLSNP